MESFRKILSIWRARDNRFKTSGMYECSKGKLWKLSCVQGKGNSNAWKLQIKAILRLELRTIGCYCLFIPNKKPSISTSTIVFSSLFRYNSNKPTFLKHANKSLKTIKIFQFMGSTLENDLHNEANLDVSFAETSAMLHPSAEALAVLPLLWT